MLQKNKGRLEIICGSMFSGKTEELIRRLKRAEYAKQNVLTIKHKIDTRKSLSSITSHDGKKRLAVSMDNETKNLKKILGLVNKNIQVIGIDEVQFFPPKMIDIIMILVDLGKRVICTGFEIDFRGVPMSIMPTLLCLADQVTKLKAICVKCGREGHHTQRIINGKPANFSDPIVLVGGEECYEARCRNCFEIDKQKTYSIDARINLKEKEENVQL